MIDEIINNAVAVLNKKKEMLILERIEKLTTFKDKFDILEESKRTFPRIRIVYNRDDQSENYYWNNGSENGLHLISFYPDNDLKFQDNKFTIGFKYK